MNSGPISEPSLGMTVAGLGVRVACTDPDLLAYSRQAVLSFPGPVRQKFLCQDRGSSAGPVTL